MGAIRICASVACADYLHLGRDLAALEAAGVDYLHIDIMDGAFVPNLALNFDTMRAVRRACGLPMDVHLMVERPETYVDRAAEAGAEVIIPHAEATQHLPRLLAQIRAVGCAPGVALNPQTPLQALDYVLDDLDLVLIMTVNPGFQGQKLIPQMLAKIAACRSKLDATARDIGLMVDGNVSLDNAGAMARAGADWLVGGTSSIFMAQLPIAEGVQRLRASAAAGLSGAR
ncbi:MAG: ribulose-phosphate 3-epimerase [Anaerolineae bacterium]|jgi:ribulose-phosphate 3-epimerase